MYAFPHILAPFAPLFTRHLYAKGYQTEDGVGDAIRESALDRRELYLTTKWSGLTTIPEAIDNSLKEVCFSVTPLQ